MIKKLNKGIDCIVIWSTINNAVDRAKNWSSTFKGLKIAKANKRLKFQQGTRNALLFDCKYWTSA